MIEKLAFVSDLPGLALVKDLEFRFVSVSHDFARLFGWKSAHDCPGKNDFDIPCKASEFAEGFRKLDQIVLESGQKMVSLEIQNYSTGCGMVLAEKNPIRDEQGKIEGFYHPLINVTNVPLFQAYVGLHLFDSKSMGTAFKPASYRLTETHSPLPLTNKQENILFLLIRGKSAKEIAKILAISPRTVESHLELIKSKLQCSYKSELIEKAIHSGFLYYVPKDLQQADFGKMIDT